MPAGRASYIAMPANRPVAARLQRDALQARHGNSEPRSPIGCSLSASVARCRSGPPSQRPTSPCTHLETSLHAFHPPSKRRSEKSAGVEENRCVPKSSRERSRNGRRNDPGDRLPCFDVNSQIVERNFIYKIPLSRATQSTRTFDYPA